MKQVIILGCGMVGTTMALDLAADPALQVTVADVRPMALAALSARAKVKTIQTDLSDPAAIIALVRPFDLVIGALSSSMGLATLRAVIDAGKPYVDISFMADDALTLSPAAAAAGVVAVVDCGIAPGMSNMMAGYAASVLQPCTRLDIMVGGVPELRRWPFDYKVAFAPSDVIEEYVRPARMVEHGQIAVHPALSGVELVDIPGVGTLEAFNTDGLRSLVTTLAIPDMSEKTMRWPGHAQLMRVLQASGFFSDEPIVVGGKSVIPREVTSALLFPHWTYAPGEVDLTVLRVVATGTKEGMRVRMIWELVDRADTTSGCSSMSRTTGLPATIVARLLLSGRFTTPGVHAPEVLGAVPGLLDEVLAALGERGIHFSSRLEPA